MSAICDREGADRHRRPANELHGGPAFKPQPHLPSFGQSGMSLPSIHTSAARASVSGTKTASGSRPNHLAAQPTDQTQDGAGHRRLDDLRRLTGHANLGARQLGGGIGDFGQRGGARGAGIFQQRMRVGRDASLVRSQR